MINCFITLGASNHTDKVRQNEDYYATDPIAAERLLRIEDVPKDRPIWECAEFERMEAGGGSAVAYAWYVWRRGYKGATTLKWFN